MQHFFILTNVGIDIKTWNNELITNPFLVSHFDDVNPRYYLNRRIVFEASQYEKTYTRHFDILVYNWQTGFKDALDFSPLVYIESDYDICYKRISSSNLINKKHIESYLEAREQKIHQLLKRSNKHIVLNDNHDKARNLNALVDFLEIPYFFNLETDRQ
jgi:hypothetical protein